MDVVNGMNGCTSELWCEGGGSALRQVVCWRVHLKPVAAEHERLKADQRVSPSLLHGLQIQNYSHLGESATTDHQSTLVESNLKHRKIK